MTFRADGGGFGVGWEGIWSACKGDFRESGEGISKYVQRKVSEEMKRKVSD